MTTNVGTLDRILRAAVGVALLIMAFTMGWGTLGTVIAAVVGVVMLVVSVTRICPIYSIFGFKTCAG